ncbi:Fc.00g087990.m01.CDS01 [Cosmosporella sp. VM-42]
MNKSPSELWVEQGQKNPRSARITDATWNQYKKMLCALYKNYTLLDVMNYMQLRYDFTPSKRQYGYRFEKWGIKKYNSGDKRSPVRPVQEMENFVHEVEKMDDEFYAPPPQDIKNELTPGFLSIPRNMGISHSPGSLSATSEGTFFEGSDFGDAMSSPASPISPIFYPWDREEESKKLAADFCSAMSDDENAFRLYFELYNAASTRLSTAAKDMLVISCARAADQTKNAKLARQLLAHHQSLPFGSDKTFVFSMLGTYTQERDDTADKTAVQNHVCDIIRRVIVNDTDLANIPHGYYAIDLVAYQCLSHGLDVYEKACTANGQRPTFSSDCIINQYVESQPVAHERDGCFPLRSCVEWCWTQLSLNPRVPQEIASINANDMQRPWCNNIAVFCTLWNAMLQTVDGNTSQLPWYHDCESALGISPSELLVTVAWMIGENVSMGVMEIDILEYATASAKDILQLPEGTLWIEFLKKFGWMNKFVDPSQDDKAFEAVVLDHVRQYISNALGLHLPVPVQDPMAGISYLDQLSPFANGAGPDLLGSFGSLGGMDMSQQGMHTMPHQIG